MKKRIILATMALNLAMCCGVHAGNFQSHFAEPSVTLPAECNGEIEGIREDFFRVLRDGTPKCSEDKRLTIMIFSPVSPVKPTITRNRSTTQFSAESPADLSESTLPTPRREKGTLSKHKSESHLGICAFSKTQELTGCLNYGERMPVTCGRIKERVLKLINRPDLANPQRLLILQKLCAPCPTDESFIYGNVSEIINLRPNQIVDIKATLPESSSGSLNIFCELTDGTELICFI